MNVLEIKIHLDTPVLMTSIANGEENSSISLPYIPGGSLRGLCIWKYLQKYSQEDLLADDLARKLFFSDKVFFLNGYPARPDTHETRSYPTPRSWHVKKDERDRDQRTLFDFVFYPNPAQVYKPKREKQPFFVPIADETDKYLFAPLRYSNVHNFSVNPMLKKKGTSTVFRYEALATGQTFIAYIISDENDLLSKLKKRLPDGRYRLGASQTAGYGQVSLAVSRQEWSRVRQSEAERDLEVENVTTITLLSDAILQTDKGQPSTDFHDTMASILQQPDLPEPIQIYAGTTLVGGFNHKWELPLPQAVALSMGSTFVYRAEDLPVSLLDDIVWHGIGERRNEGYGRVAVNINHASQSKAIHLEPTLPSEITLSPASKRIAQKMALRRLQKVVGTAVNQYISQITIASKPENAQLSQLRIIMRQAQQEKSFTALEKYLGNMKSTPQNQFHRRYLHNLPREQPEADDKPAKVKLSWAGWLNRRRHENDGLTLLGIDPQQPDYQIGGETISEAQQSDLAFVVTCQLIEAVVRRALKEK